LESDFKRVFLSAYSYQFTYFILVCDFMCGERNGDSPSYIQNKIRLSSIMCCTCMRRTTCLLLNHRHDAIR